MPLDDADRGGWLGRAVVANWVIWGVFIAEYVVVVSLTDDKRAYTRSAWLDLLMDKSHSSGWSPSTSGTSGLAAATRRTPRRSPRCRRRPCPRPRSGNRRGRRRPEREGT
jgi:hypothetical protein